MIIVEKPTNLLFQQMGDFSLQGTAEGRQESRASWFASVEIFEIFHFPIPDHTLAAVPNAVSKAGEGNGPKTILFPQTGID